MNSTNLIRRMSFFQMVGALFKIYRISFMALSIITLINIVISFVILGIGIAVDNVNSDIAIVIVILYLFMPILYTGPILIAMSNTVLGNKVLVGDSYRQGLSFGLILKTIIVALIPGIIALVSLSGDTSDTQVFNFYMVFFILMPAWIFFPIISQLEKKGFFPALGRSIKLYFQNFFRIILIILLSIVFAIPWALIGAGIDALLGNLIKNALNVSDLDVGILYAVPVVTMFAISLYVMAYYETRARRENYTADVLSQELGFAPLDEMMSV